MCVITILNANHQPMEVEVSVEIHQVYEDSRRQEERQRYERRKHIDGRSFDNCLLFELATEPLEQTVERLEMLQGNPVYIARNSTRSAVSVFFFFVYGYSIQRLQRCRAATRLRSCVPPSQH